jgi:hypothetical protein
MTFLSAAAILSVIYLFYVMACLSERLGSVEKMVPRYRYYYAAILFLSVGLIAHIAGAQLEQSGQYLSPWIWLLAYDLPLAVGVTIGILITWQYWSWLITENKQ